MKKLAIIVFLLSALYSCKKDEPIYNNQTITTSLLTGKWYLVQDTTIDYINGKVTGTTTMDNPGVINPDYYTEFYGNGTGRVTITGLLSIDFNYVVTGDKIVLTVAGQPSTAAIKLSSNSLIFYFDDTSTDANGDVIRETEVQYYVKK